MKKPVPLLVILLIAWITGSSIWYLCKIRGHCQKKEINTEEIAPVKQELESHEIRNKEETATTANSVSLESAKVYLKSVGDKTFHFDFASSDIEFRIEDDQYVKSLIRYLADTPASYIIVEGHSDAIGTPEAKQSFSRQRAEIVYNYLVDLGINPDQVKLEAKGDSKPVASNENEEGRSKNRRAVIIIH